MQEYEGVVLTRLSSTLYSHFLTIYNPDRKRSRQLTKTIITTNFFICIYKKPKQSYNIKATFEVHQTVFTIRPRHWDVSGSSVDTTPELIQFLTTS